MAENAKQNNTETMKMVAAIVLGVLALAALLYAFGPGLLWSTKPAVSVTVSTPTPARNGNNDLKPVAMPSRSDQDQVLATTPIFYRPGSFMAPDPGRNIFAFYEPPPPTPFVPTPEVYVPPPTLPPTPAPPIQLAYAMPQNVFAGSRGFRLEVHGDKFTPDSRVYLSQTPLQTTFISPQRLAAEVPANLITAEGPRQLIIQTPDGKLYSNQIFFSVQAPPRPTFQYVGLTARRHANNDTAYFAEPGRPEPFSARLNDVLGGRFRLSSITSDLVVLEDVNLGFRHQLNMVRPDLSRSQPMPSGPVRGGSQQPSVEDQYQQMMRQQQEIQRRMQQQQRNNESKSDDSESSEPATNTRVPQQLPGMPGNIPTGQRPAANRPVD